MTLSLNVVKNAAITTISVLAIVYALNQIAVTRPLVQKALA